jgi:photosystem II stability/assembly factor-like uncharacterized protein
MHLKPINLFITLIFLGAVGLGSCTAAPRPGLPAAVPTASGFFPLGHWEVLRRIDYGTLSKAYLKGDIGPAYLAYMVTLAGFHTDSFGLTVGPDDDARYTTDGGQSWTKAASALFCRFGLEIVDEKVAWHCGNGGTRVTVNGGQTWQTVAPSACPYMSFLDSQTGWTASPYRLQATSDGGASWNAVALPPAMRDIVAVALRTAEDGYVLDTAGNLLVTADAGQSWQVHSLGLKTGERLIPASVGPKAAMRFLDARNGMVIFDLEDRTVWFAVTQDGGQSWQRAEIPDLREQSYYYHLFLAHDGHLLTVTDDFNDTNSSLVLRYQSP